MGRYSAISGIRVLSLPKRRDYVLAEQLDGLHDPLVGDSLGGHEELDLVHSRRLMDLDGLDATRRVSGHDDAPVAHGGGVKLFPDALSQSCAAG